jgi:hypothetical protein
MENYMGLSGHPDVKRYLEHKGSSPKTPIQQFLDGNMLKKLAAESGADDSGLISIDDPLLADQRQDILSAFPKCKSLLSIVCRLNRNNVRCIDRAVSDTAGKRWHKCIIPGQRLSNGYVKMARKNVVRVP